MTEDRELRCTALAMALRLHIKRGLPAAFTVEDVRTAAQCFYGFLTDTQSEAQRLGLAPTRPMTPEEFRAHYGEQVQTGGPPPVRAWNSSP